jgi:ABC-type cobalamin/Fe3+-siderophores transport system ATPase subunit
MAVQRRIVSLGVSGESFLQDVRFEFAERLNCIVAGRGRGKTTTVEFLRHVLAPSARASKDTQSQVQATLQRGRASVEVQIESARYTASRALGDAATTLTGASGRSDASIEELFPYDYYAHGEIEAIGEDHASQLRLLDGFARAEIADIGAEITSTLAQLQRNAGELRRVADDEERLRSEAEDVATLLESLSTLQPPEGGDSRAHELKAAQDAKGLRARERTAVEAARDAAKLSRREAAGLGEQAARRFAATIDQVLLEGANREIIVPLATQIQKTRLALERAAEDMQRACDDLEVATRSNEQQLATRHAAQDEAYRNVLEQAREEQGRTRERERVQERLAKAQQAEANLRACETERRNAQQRRRELLGNLSKLRDRRFRVRERVAGMLSARLRPQVQVTITQSGDRAAYVEALTGALHKSGIMVRPVVEKIVRALGPEELAVLVVRGDKARLAEEASLNPDQAEKVIWKLAFEGRAWDLETIELGDVPRIELFDGVYKESTELSPGQRCTAVLPILLLLESDRPLVIDQPEDEVDGDTLVGTIVRSVREVKATRQLVLVTHNPNIVVLGDAERVFVLESTGTRARIEAVGTVDETKDHIQRLLEGGSEAFLERKRRYGY